MARPRSSNLKPVVALGNQIALNVPKDNMAMIDLHGLSEEQAKRTVTTRIKEAQAQGWDKIRFVTGRGNHVNSKGERGTLYKNFKDWVVDVQTNVAEVGQHDGFYEVEIKRDVPIYNPFDTFFTAQIQKLLADNIENYKAGAAQGNVDDLMALGVCYEKGLGVTQSYKDSTNCYLQIKDGKNAIVEYEVGCRYFIGKGVRLNNGEAIKYLTLSAEQKYAPAAFVLAIIHWKGIIDDKYNLALGHKYFLIAAEQGNAEAARRVGCSFYDGVATGQKDLEKAIYWWKQGAEGGDCVAAFNLVHVYEGTDPKQALHYLAMSAELGDPDGQLFLGFKMYFGAPGVPQNCEQALVLLNKAAAHSHHAQYLLFEYWMGKDKSKAKSFLIAAAENGNIEAQYLVVMQSPARFNQLFMPTDLDLAKAYVPMDQALRQKIETKFLSHTDEAILKMENKKIQSAVINMMVCQDSTAAQVKSGIRILRKLIEENNTDAVMKLVGIYLQDGYPGVKKNPQEALGLLNKGAKLNSGDCYCAMGYYWRDGLGGKIDTKKAFSCFEKSAALNNAAANFRLGCYYAIGRDGVVVDLQRAVKCFETSMALDDPKQRKRGGTLHPQDNSFKHAGEALGNMYYLGGKNFPKNIPLALELYDKAANDGSEDSAMRLSQHYMLAHELELSIRYLSLAASFGHQPAIDGLKILNQQPMFKPYLESYKASQQALSEEKPALKVYELNDKADVPDSVLVSLLQKKSGLKFFAKRDANTKVDAVVECDDEKAYETIKTLQQKLGRGNFFNVPGRQNSFFVLEGINLPGNPALGEHIQKTLRQ